MCLPSPWCCIQGWWGVCFVQLCGIRQPETAHRCRKGARRALEGTDMELRQGAQVGPSRTAGQAKHPTEHGDVRFALQWTGLHQQAAAGWVSYLPHARWQMAAALATAGGRLVGGPERPQEPFITKARYSTPKPTAES